nr:ribokinase [Marinibactrum halimedae]
MGSTNWDICMYLPHLPTPGETVGEGRLKTNLGGKGANQAVACHRAGANTTFISCIGDDATGTTVREEFEAIGLNTSAVATLSNTTTGTACIFIDESAENCIGLTAGANGELTPELVNQHRDTISAADVLLVQLETPIESVLAAAKIAHEAKTKVILNPAPARSLPDELFQYVDVLTPNEGELAQLSGMPTDTEDELNAAAEALIHKGVTNLIVTLGKNGAALFQDQWAVLKQTFAPFVVDAKDTTAAGDTFSGNLAAVIAQTGDYTQAIETAMAAAALSVTREGAIPSIPTREETTEFSKNHR